MRNLKLTLIIALAILFTGCAVPVDSPDNGSASTAADSILATQTNATIIEDAGLAESHATETQSLFVEASPSYFSDRDLAGTYDESKAAFITLTGTGAACKSSAVQINGSTITITDEGTYIFSGTLNDGMIIVNTGKQNKVQIVLDGASITSAASAPIYVLQADKVFLTLASGTENSLSNGGSFEAIDENSIDSVIFSKEDLTLNGSGRLTITSPAGHGIVSKDELTVTGGTYEISAASHGLNGKDNVCIAAGSLTITAGKDGIQAENDADTTLGFVRIEGGNFNIICEGDGISASASMEILGGDFSILAGGGSANGEQKTSDNWGMMGGGPGDRGGPNGGYPGEPGQQQTETEAEEDSTSIKGLKASGDLTISGGSFTIDAADDAIHSNANVRVSGGSFEIATGDDGFHADENLNVSGGNIHITTSYEGLEGLNIDFTGGDVTMVCIDDGLNAAGGTDQSGFGGMRGGDMFGADPDSYINISGGTIYINASGDGIDSNGDLTISGGHVTVCGPTQGDTAVLDFGGSGTITGGTFIGSGSYMMAQVFESTGEQGVFAVSVGNQAAGTEVVLTDSQGNTVISTTPVLDFAIVILSSRDIVKGETYNITIGSSSGSFEAN